MLKLPLPEMIIFICAVILSLASGLIGIVQLRGGGVKHRRLLPGIIAAVICLEVAILILRAIAIKAIPLTGLFESMIVLTIVFGLIFLFFSTAVRQVWFGSVMVWAILMLTVIAAFVAKPASAPYAAAATPWAIAHGISMILSGASVMFATTCACLFLFARRNLKRKKIMRVLGKVPNIEKLEQMNLLGLEGCFVLITFGLLSGMGLAAASSAELEISPVEWLTDSKIILIIVAWLLSGAILALRSIFSMKDKIVAYMTITAFFLILFAIAGTTIFCGTKHDFNRDDAGTVRTERPL